MQLTKDEVLLLTEHPSLLLRYFQLCRKSIEQNRTESSKIGYVQTEITEAVITLESRGLVKEMKDGSVKIGSFFRGKKEPLKPEVEAKYQEYLKEISSILKKPRGFGVGCEKSRKQFNSALQEYSYEQLLVVARKAAADRYHIENGFRYLTPEFLTRSNKIIYFMNQPEILRNNPFSHPGR